MFIVTKSYCHILKLQYRQSINTKTDDLANDLVRGRIKLTAVRVNHYLYTDKN